MAAEANATMTTSATPEVAPAPAPEAPPAAAAAASPAAAEAPPAAAPEAPPAAAAAAMETTPAPAVSAPAAPAPAAVEGAATSPAPPATPGPPAPIAVATTELHTEGPCEVLHVAADGRWMLASGGDGRLVCVDAGASGADADAEADSPPPGASTGPRSWMARLVPPSAVLTAAAVSPDRLWLAMGQETAEGFGAWVQPLDPALGRPTGVPKLVARFTLPVRHLAWHSSQPILGIAADDGKLCTWERIPPTSTEGEASAAPPKPRRRDLLQSAQGGGARCAALDPAGELVAASLTGGALVVIQLRDGKELARTMCWAKVPINTDKLVLTWSPHGDYLALPGEPTVRVLARSKLLAGGSSSRAGAAAAAEALLLSGGHRHATTCAAWAPATVAAAPGGVEAGLVLATASCDAVALWRFAGGGEAAAAPTASLVQVLALDAPPQSLAFSADASQLLVGTQKGSWARVRALKEGAEAAAAAAETPPTAAASTTAASAAPGEEAPAASAGEQLFPEDPTAADAAPLEGEEAPRIEQPTLQLGATGVAAASSSATTRPRRRYLAWNDHGSLKFFPPGRQGGRSGGGGAIGSGTGQVIVEYSRDRGFSAAREVRAPPGLALGALGPGLFALAASAAPPSVPTAKIYVHIAAPWLKATSFEHALPPGETIDALAVGRHFVAAFTSPLRTLRILSLTGIPLGVLACSGSVVCLAAHEDLLLCVTRIPGSASRREPALEFSLYGISAKERLAAGALPLSEGSFLRWAGFSAEAMPLALDSSGALRALVLSGGGFFSGNAAGAAGEWLPVAELPEGGARAWPVRAEDGSLACAEVAKADDEPTFQHPKVQSVPFRLPFGSTSDGPESVLRQTFLAAHSRFAMDAGLVTSRKRKGLADRASRQKTRAGPGRLALKLSQAIARSGEVEQALEVVRCYLPSERELLGCAERPELLAEASRFATNAGLQELATKIDILRAAAEQEAQANTAATAA